MPKLIQTTAKGRFQQSVTLMDKGSSITTEQLIENAKHTTPISNTFTSNSTTAFNILDINIEKDNVSIIYIDLAGVTGTTKLFHGRYSQMIYNNNGTYTSAGDELELIKTKNGFSVPTVAFDISTKKVTLTPGSGDSTKWWVWGTVHS